MTAVAAAEQAEDRCHEAGGALGRAGAAEQEAGHAVQADRPGEPEPLRGGEEGEPPAEAAVERHDRVRAAGGG